MQKRERILAIGAGVLIGGYLVTRVFGSLLQAPLQARYDKVERLNKEIAKNQAVINRARRAARKLDDWQQQSLPSNLEVAASLYQEWLLDQVSKAGFKTPNVDSGGTISHKGIYHVLPFSIRGRATLEQLTTFLFQFYSADHLHQIARINLTPLAKSSDIDLALAIEALVLPEADRTDKLSTRKSSRLASEQLSDYAAIVERNLFGQAGTGLDPADFAFLTAILMVDNVPQAWLTIRTTGEILKLSPGQAFEVGQFHGTIAQINSPDIIIDADEERWLLTLGEKLSQAVALPPSF